MLIEGAGALDVAAVARRIGVSESLAYYHFASKAGLLTAVVHDFYERMDDRVAAVAFEGESWAERERARVAALVDFMYADPVAPLVVGAIAADPALFAFQRERQQRLDALGARNIAQAQRDGEIAADLDPRLLVSMLLAGVFAGVCDALMQDPPRPQAEVERQVWSFVARAAGVAPDRRGE